MSAAASESSRREDLFNAASLTLRAISSRMRQEVADNAPASKPELGSFADEWALRLGPAVIGMDPAVQVRGDAWGPWAPSFEVIAHAAIGVTIPQDEYGYRGRVHSLWFCDATVAGVYRWFETGFMVSPLMSRTTESYPVAFEPSENAGKALSNAITEWQVAWPFTAIDRGQEPSFVERWLEWFGAAATGQLRRPSSQPEVDPHGSWRRR
jgi:serine/threonine-protein kinase